MKLNEWLDNEVGRTRNLAAHLKRSASAVSQWRTNGVPVDLMRSVRDFTNGDVSIEEMLPEEEKAPA